jgi:hypothetical protein
MGHGKRTKLDLLALIVAVVVDLSLNAIAMITISPGPFEAVAFVAVAFLVVIFGVRAWLKGSRLLWAIFALSALFFDVSFMLSATDIQSASVAEIVTIESDSQLERLLREETRLQENYTDLQSQFKSAYKRETMDQLQIQIVATREDLKTIREQYNKRLSEVESGELTQRTREQRATIAANDIFDAIETAFKKERYIEIIIFFMLFSGLQLTIIKAAEEEKNTEPPEKKRRQRRPIKKQPGPALVYGGSVILKEPIITKSDVENFVKANWKKDKVNSDGFDPKKYLQIKQVLTNIDALFFGDRPSKSEAETLEIIERITKI